MSNTIGWGQGVLNPISWGADGQVIGTGEEVINVITEDFNFAVTEDSILVINETTLNDLAGGFGSIYDASWSGETMLER